LEAAKTVQKDATQEAAIRPSIKEQERRAQFSDEMEAAKAIQQDPTRQATIQAFTKEQQRLKQRVEELETSKTATEDATRWIIGDSFSKLGSNINQNVGLGGTLESIAGTGTDFSGQSFDSIELTTAQLDFEIRVNDWTQGIFTIEWLGAADTLFSTSRGFGNVSERLNIETALVTFGDPQKFPPFLTVGRMVLPFGISTGTPVADTLTSEDPLTLEVFETRKTAIGVGLGFPTPALTPATPPITPPAIKPQLFNPLFSSLSSNLGYNPPPTRPPTPTPITPTPESPLFNVGVYSYDGHDTVSSSGWDPANHISATAGFRTQGNCGRSYDQLGDSFLCPWAIDVDIDYNSSIFDSRFLEFEYEHFLDQIGFVPAMAVSAKARFGRVSLVAEWNGAIDQARFREDGIGLDENGVNVAIPGKAISIRPSAWQVSLGYQFDWNPWVEVIGEKGTYLAIGYSQSQDLAGVRQFNDTDNTLERVGFVPKRRFLVNLSEWIMDGVRVSFEYSHLIDYPSSEGGTGNSANGFFTAVTYAW
jgi:hypothetical protein